MVIRSQRCNSTPACGNTQHMMNYRNAPFARRALSGIAALTVALAAAPALAQSTIGSGTQIVAHLSTPDIRTNKNQVGDTFAALIAPPYATRYLQGATVYGHVAAIQSGGQGRTAHLQLALDRIVFSDGQSSRVSATSTAIAEIKDNTTARKALGAGAGAAVGSQTVGRLLGGALGGVVGIAGGAAAGYAYAKNDRPNFDVQTGARMVFNVSQPASIPRRQMESR
jgi:hypothetical protein